MFIVSQAFFCQRTFPFLNLFADCLRVGWWVGVTWTSINKTVDTTFLFIVSDTALEQSKANICPGERSGLLIDDDHLFSEHRRWRTIKIFWSFQCDLWPQEGGVWSIDFTATTNRKIEARLHRGAWLEVDPSGHTHKATPLYIPMKLLPCLNSVTEVTNFWRVLVLLYKWTRLNSLDCLLWLCSPC